MVFLKLFLENALAVRPYNCQAVSDSLLPNVACSLHTSSLIALYSLRKPKVFALQILQRYLTKEGHVRKFFYCSYGQKNLAFDNLKGSHVRNFLGFRKLYTGKCAARVLKRFCCCRSKNRATVRSRQRSTNIESMRKKVISLKHVKLRVDT